jgi:DNA-binding MarR family transcriptional regulator
MLGVRDGLLLKHYLKKISNIHFTHYLNVSCFVPLHQISNKMEIAKEIKQDKFKNEYQKMIINIMFTSGWLTTKFTHDYLKSYKVSTQQFNLLRILRGQFPKPATINLLIDRMLDKNSNASRLVEKLRLKKFVERTTCPEDRRAVNVIITKKGLDLLSELDKQEEIFVNKLKTISKKEAEMLNVLLDKLRS